MCIEDVKIGHETASSDVVSVTVAATATPIVPFNRQRRSLIIFPPPANPVFIGKTDSVTVDNGGRINIGIEPIRLTLDNDGTIVHGPIFGIVAAATERIAFIESLFSVKEWDKENP